MALIEVKNYTFSYPGCGLPALSDVKLNVERGEFVVICGPSGCGKTTLLRCMKPAISPHGERRGEIFFDGKAVEELDLKRQSSAVGFVGQSPEDGIVTDKVWHELAFGPESLGMGTEEMRRRVAETAAFFGIDGWYRRDVSELSGGQKQLLNLASVMVTSPEALILDEPTSQLDPIAASELMGVLGRINRELGVTVILTEHRLEEALAQADRCAVMEKGRIICSGTPGEVGRALRDMDSGMFLAMPAPMRIWAGADRDGLDCPVTVREGREWIQRFAVRHELAPVPEERRCKGGGTAVECRNVWFKYERDLPDAVRGLTFTLRRGEILAVLGGNGAGKTTMLRLIAGTKKPYRGDIELMGRAAALPQDPRTLFVKKTVGEDILELLPRGGKDSEELTARTVELCGLEGLLDRHPYDMSGGEQQRAALAKILVTRPDILLLDEPTKGLDAGFKRRLGQILERLCEKGVSIIIVSHDVEFCARYAHRCALMFDGRLTAQGTPREFFAGNSFYTTAANRMCRSVLPEVVTVEDAIAACGGIIPEEENREAQNEAPPEPAGHMAAKGSAKLPLWRKIIAAAAGIAAAGTFIAAAGVTDLSVLSTAEGATAMAAGTLRLYVVFIASLAVLALAVSRRGGARKEIRPIRERGKLSRRTCAALALIVLLIPLTLAAGIWLLDGRKYYFIALLILVEASAPFFIAFEGRRPRARELAVVAALCAMAVVSRGMFFMLQQAKPVMAIVIISGAALGGETGFLVGAVTMLVSNLMFSQGPWTPWQMFAMGLVGALAGTVFQIGGLERSRGTLAAFGAAAAVVVYGGIMNPSAALIWAREINVNILLTYFVTGFPFDCVQAAATAVFLWLAGEPMLEKLERLRRKYNI